MKNISHLIVAELVATLFFGCTAQVENITSQEAKEIAKEVLSGAWVTTFG